MSQVVGLPNNSYKPITNTAWVRARLSKLQKGALDSQPQVKKFTSCLPMVGTWFSLGTPASSTTKTGRHDIVKIFLKVALKHQKSINQSTLCSKECMIKDRNTHCFHIYKLHFGSSTLYQKWKKLPNSNSDSESEVISLHFQIKNHIDICSIMKNRKFYNQLLEV